MATPTEMTTFLAEVERRAFKQALYATHDEDHALDIVQDAMLKLADRYAHAPAEELPLLFQRIPQFIRLQVVLFHIVRLRSSLGVDITSYIHKSAS